MPQPFEISCIKLNCKHYQHDKLTHDKNNKSQPFTYRCPAFPDGIPEEIRSGKLKHNKVLENQVGTFIYEEVR